MMAAGVVVHGFLLTTVVSTTIVSTTGVSIGMEVFGWFVMAARVVGTMTGTTIVTMAGTTMVTTIASRVLSKVCCRFLGPLFHQALELLALSFDRAPLGTLADDCISVFVHVLFNKNAVVGVGRLHGVRLGEVLLGEARLVGRLGIACLQ